MDIRRVAPTCNCDLGRYSIHVDKRIMSWLDEAIDRLSEMPICGYYPNTEPAVEPTALTAMALMTGGRSAAVATDWLVERQAADGSLGIDVEKHSPRWPTGWAVLAWLAASSTGKSYTKPIDRAVQWILSTKAEAGTTEQSSFFGHDASLEAWSWVKETHSWIEPTSINLTALKATGYGDHPRCREAVKLLIDRMLPDGGWNYGNTVVLGNTLRPHLQPTGLALIALADEAEAVDRFQPSIEYLYDSLDERTATASLCYGLMGLEAQERRPAEGQKWLKSSYHRTLDRDGSPYKLALIVLAAHADRCPWADKAASVALDSKNWTESDNDV